LSPSRSILKRAALTGATATAFAVATALIASPVAAHGFGQRYDLPIPLSLYVSGAAMAIVVSFLVVALFMRDKPPAHPHLRIDLLATRVGRWLTNPALVFALKLVALGIFIITVIAGLRGDQNPYRNIAPTMVWIVFWIGLAYVSAFIGNVWAVLNPWRTIFETLDTLFCALSGRAGLSLDLRYPATLGVWPAFVLLLAFSWTELIYPDPALPRFIAELAIAYTVLTLAGMVLFGGERWLQHGEVFTLVFATFGRFAPIELRTGTQGGLWLRPFGAGLLDSSAVTTSMMAFVLGLLATVLYDGALATPEWGRLETILAEHLAGLGEFKLMAIRTAGLIGFWLLFFGAYVGVSAMMSALTSAGLSALALARSFALTLVPIAIGYHLAHYLTYLLIQGQYVIPLASDPFGFGWNLFGTATYRVDIGVVGARFAWYAAVTAILTGHIAAVYLAHRKATELFDARALALRSQVPLTALMVAYTFVSLSILAEPIVERRAPAQPSEVSAELAVPADAVVPEIGSGRLQPVGAGKIARQKLTYRVLASAFHDGTRMSAADLLYSYAFAYRWGAGESADPGVAAATAVMRERLLGVRVVGSDNTSKSFRFGDFEVTRELFVVEVYTSAPPIDPEQDAVVAPPWSTLPWHLLVLMEEAVARDWAAFSQGEADRRGVEWLDLVRSPQLAKRMAALVDTFAHQGYRPPQLASMVSAEDARKRWNALAAFYKERGHLLVTNGPYQLKRWTRESVTLEAFRDLSYPLGVGSYDNYAVPRRGFITNIERSGELLKISGDIELVQKHMRSYDIVRKPLQAVDADARRRSAPECRYVVIDGADRIVLAGQVPVEDDATFHVDLAGRLPTGNFVLVAQLLVNGNAMNAEIKRIPLVISASP
jgi:hypothetical protein